MKVAGFLPEEEHRKRIPKKPISAGALVLDEHDRILMVKPLYRKYWTIPGGVVDQNESPRQACIREVREEVGYDMRQAVLLSVIFYIEEDSYEGINFHFYGGRLREDEKPGIRIDANELGDFEFMDIEKAAMMGSVRKNRILRQELKAALAGTCLYIEQSKDENDDINH